MGLILSAFSARAQQTGSQSGTSTQQSAAQATARADVKLLRERVEAILGEAQERKADWGVLVVDRDSGETLFNLNAERFFTPASNTKLFTTVFALASLGTGYRFRTTLESSGTQTSGGKLSGDLTLVARGDPDVSNRKFPFAGKMEREDAASNVRKAQRDGPTDRVLSELVDAAVARGLKEVDGDIVVDDRAIPFDPYPAGWSVGDLFFSFGAPVTAIAFNENTVSIEMSPGANAGDPAVVVIDPADAAPGFTRNITTSAAGSEPELAVVRQPGPNFILLRGSVPLGHAPVKLDLAMTDPAETSARTLRRLLEARGVRITGKTRVEEGPPPRALKPGETPALLPAELPAQPANATSNAIVLAEHVSHPILESVRVTNKISQNLHAELLLRTVAREKTGIGSTEIGLKLEQDFLKSIGVAEGDAVLSDGSGLSADNLVTPQAVVRLLQYAIQQPWGADFLGTLPVAGADGTLEDRFKGTPAAGLIQAKTGGLEHVHALSGFATTAGGEYLVFSIFVDKNTQRGHDAISAIDAISAAMVETLGAPASREKHP